MQVTELSDTSYIRHALMRDTLQPLQAASAHCMDMLTSATAATAGTGTAGSGQPLEQAMFTDRMAADCVHQVAGWVQDSARELIESLAQTADSQTM